MNIFTRYLLAIVIGVGILSLFPGVPNKIDTSSGLAQVFPLRENQINISGDKFYNFEDDEDNFRTPVAREPSLFSVIVNWVKDSFSGGVNIDTTDSNTTSSQIPCNQTSISVKAQTQVLYKGGAWQGGSCPNAISGAINECKKQLADKIKSQLGQCPASCKQANPTIESCWNAGPSAPPAKCNTPGASSGASPNNNRDGTYVSNGICYARTSGSINTTVACNCGSSGGSGSSGGADSGSGSGGGSSGGTCEGGACPPIDTGTESGDSSSDSSSGGTTSGGRGGATPPPTPPAPPVGTKACGDVAVTGSAETKQQQVGPYVCKSGKCGGEYKYPIPWNPGNCFTCPQTADSCKSVKDQALTKCEQFAKPDAITRAEEKAKAACQPGCTYVGFELTNGGNCSLMPQANAHQADPNCGNSGQCPASKSAYLGGKSCFEPGPFTAQAQVTATGLAKCKPKATETGTPSNTQ